MSLQACAHIGGPAAWVFMRVLSAHLSDELDQLERSLPRGFPPGARRQVLETFRDVQAAGEAWLDDQEARQALDDRRTSQARNADDSRYETAASSQHDRTDEILTARQVADLLDVSVRRAQQLGNDGLGFKLDDAPNAPWLFHRDLVLAYARNGDGLT